MNMMIKFAGIYLVSILLISILFASTANATVSHYPKPVIPAHCTSVNGLPDSKCTPGATNPDVTQDNIKKTICKPGFSKSIRPPVSYTEPLKKKLMESYGFTDSLSNYELDHLIPLEVGGNPYDAKNLWPQAHYGQAKSLEKDKYESYLNKQVCSGKISLHEAQMEISTNWMHYWNKSH
jgi:hypothetical protein